ncbi:AI-2E family transporter [Barnesiella viscericola]|uniref:AI-2E family transporter n=1 Tax=Barnesiella viscericola TaxID=397865 RepID=A0A921MS65_9BACT|nr:AI-2E family transporter [Barnesiella viscericola]HJG89177.1 AI-2E family transporter [Barnesiella viscericola]
MTERQPYTFDRVIRILFGAVFVVGLFYLIYILRGALLPFLVAWIVAYMLNPLVVYNKRVFKLKGRVIAIALAFLEVLVTLALLAVLVLPSIIDEIGVMRRLLSDYVYHSSNLPFVPQAVHDFIRQNVDFTQLSNLLSREQWLSVIEESFSGAWGFITGSVGEIINIVSWLIVLLYIVFILLDYDKILVGFQRMIPQRYRPMVVSIVSDIEVSMNRYFRGQALVAGLVGILFCIGFLIVGLPLAIVLGLFIGVLNMVPYLQLVGLIPTVLLCLVSASETGANFWLLFGACILVFIVVQLIEDIFIVPRVMGKVTGLNPAIILLSLSIWGTLLGFVGMIIALPLTTLCLSYYERYVIGDEAKSSPSAPPEPEVSSEEMTKEKE